MKALIVIDMLKDFLGDGRLGCDRGDKIIPVICRLIKLFREEQNPVIYANDSHLPDIDDEFRIFGPHAVRGTRSAELIDEIKPEEEDYIMIKRRYSAFSGTDLHYYLIENKVREVVLVGLHTHICVKHTAYDAFLNGYKITVIKDAVESFTEEDHQYGLNYLKKVYGARIVSEKEF